MNGTEQVLAVGPASKLTTTWGSIKACYYIMPIVDELLHCGVSGFQGFQWEYGVRLEELVSKRTTSGEKLTLFAGPSVAATLRFDLYIGAPDLPSDTLLVLQLYSGLNCSKQSH